MFTRLSDSLDDLLALAGLISLLSGIYLWIGLPPTLILLGIVLIFIGIRIDIRKPSNEPDKAANPPTA